MERARQRRGQERYGTGGWKPDLRRLPEVVRAPRSDAVYNCHAYLTKIPMDAIRPFIEAFTQPGERVVDMFAGSGMTGLAAASAGRTAVLSDISVLGQHIARGYLTAVPVDRIRQEAGRAVARARERIGDLYMTTRLADGAEVEMVRTIWSFVYACPSCKASLVYFEHLDAFGRPPQRCPRCPEPFARRSWPKVSERPVRVVVAGARGKQVEQAAQRVDAGRVRKAEKDQRQRRVPSLRIEAQREMFSRSGLGRAGIVETKQFFSARNAVALCELWNALGRVGDSKVRRKLRFAFTACLARASRRYQWGPKRPLNAQNQTYYVAPVYFEWNVFDLFERKVDAVLRSDALLLARRTRPPRGLAGGVEYRIASAARLAHLEDASVEYVFTDPPFGSNIFYSDMNLFHEAWLGRATDDADEAVMHTSGPKRHAAAERYERLLNAAFREAFRVLRPGRFMSVVFGNSSGRVWALVQRAIREAGFSEPVHMAILDKGQRSVKGLSSGSEGVVTVDLVLTVRKPVSKRRRRAAGDEGMGAELLWTAASTLDEPHSRNPSYLYAAVVREATRRGQRLDCLHYRDLLLALRNAGFAIDPKKGLLDRPLRGRLLNAERRVHSARRS